MSGVASLLGPLVMALERHVVSADKLHGDDTPVPVLVHGNGRTKTARLWVYVRDERPMAGTAPPAVWFQYSPDRKGERPRTHLKDFSGILQADGYRIAALYEIEKAIRGKPADERRRARQDASVPKLAELHHWMQRTLAATSAKSDLAKAILYSLKRWVALTRYADDGCIERDKNAAEREIRAVASRRKHWLFAGSDAGGDRAAVMYSLIGSAKLNGLDPEAYLRHVIERIADHPVNRVAELLPWNVAAAIRRSNVDQRLAA